jgi:hypothetical protein
MNTGKMNANPIKLSKSLPESSRYYRTLFLSSSSFSHGGIYQLTWPPLPNGRCQHALLPLFPAQPMCRDTVSQWRWRNLDHLGRSTLQLRYRRPASNAVVASQLLTFIDIEEDANPHHVPFAWSACRTRMPRRLHCPPIPPIYLSVQAHGHVQI